MSTVAIRLSEIVESAKALSSQVYTDVAEHGGLVSDQSIKTASELRRKIESFDRDYCGK